MIHDKYAVLLVDDSDDDRHFVRRALERHGRFAIAAEVSDGQEAIDYLAGTGPYADRTACPWPDLILLDLKMPRKNGFDVLAWIRSQHIADVKVVVLSGSFLEQDVTQSLEMGAHGYHKKTSVRQEQLEMASQLEQLVAGG
ncbi:two-component system response regulator [Verrucomicrobia bacterium LW23]|nr:two-component system response regulator [Verrucomicrobia bacterium LW23]